MWGLYRLWVLPTLELAFGMGSSKVLYHCALSCYSIRIEFSFRKVGESSVHYVFIATSGSLLDQGGGHSIENKNNNNG